MEEIKEASKLYVLSLLLEISSGYAVMDAVVGVELRDCQIVFALQWQWLLWLSTDVFWVTPPLPLLDLNHSYLIIFKQVFKCHVSTVI